VVQVLLVALAAVKARILAAMVEQADHLQQQVEGVKAEAEAEARVDILAMVEQGEAVPLVVLELLVLLVVEAVAEAVEVVQTGF
jgi:hypothetical protein